MRASLFAGLFMLSLIALAGCGSDANSTDLAALEGEWAWVAIEENGQLSSPNEIKGQQWMIKGEEITAKFPAIYGVADHKMSFKIDATQSPKSMDLIPQYEPEKGKVSPTTYSIEADKLRVAYRDNDNIDCAMIFERISR